MGILLTSLRMCIKGKNSVHCAELRTVKAAGRLIEDRFETRAPWVFNSIICLVTWRSLFNPLNTKRRLLYLKTQFVPRSKHFLSRL